MAAKLFEIEMQITCTHMFKKTNTCHGPKKTCGVGGHPTRSGVNSQSNREDWLWNALPALCCTGILTVAASTVSGGFVNLRSVDSANVRSTWTKQNEAKQLCTWSDLASDTFETIWNLTSCIYVSPRGQYSQGSCSWVRRRFARSDDKCRMCRCDSV